MTEQISGIKVKISKDFEKSVQALSDQMNLSMVQMIEALVEHDIVNIMADEDTARPTIELYNQHEWTDEVTKMCVAQMNKKDDNGMIVIKYSRGNAQ